jgi:hypothetical protein
LPAASGSFTIITHGPVSHEVHGAGTPRSPEMADDLKSAGNWAKELAIPEKKLKDALKAAGLEPDGKKGVCALYSKATIAKAQKAIK